MLDLSVTALSRSNPKLDNDNDATIEALAARRADDEAAVIAAERIRSGTADHKEDSAEALAKLGIKLPEE